jgi:hypothetical protein
MLVTAAIALIALGGTSPPVIAALARSIAGSGRRAYIGHALAVGLLALAGLGAALLASHLPAPLLGLVGLWPLLRGLGQLLTRPFSPSLSARPEPPALAAAVGNGASAYLALVATRSSTEIAVAASVLALVALVEAVLARRVARTLAPVPGQAGAAWTQVAVGVFLLVDGGALAMLRPF